MVHPRYLVVDGHSVLFALSDLRKIQQSKRTAARDELIRRLQVLHDSGQWRVTLVFDGTVGGKEKAVPGEMIIYYTTKDETADSVIERLIAQVPEPNQVLVITADQAECRLVEMLGALTSDPDWLAMEYERCESQLGEQLRDIHRSSGWTRRFT